MAQNKTQQHTRTIDIDHRIVENIDNGIIVLNTELEIYHYNKWLELRTNLKESALLGYKLTDIFQNIKSKTLIRKIKTALTMNSPTFYSASTSKYLIPIKINQIKNPNFEYMQQDVSVIPFDKEKNLVALFITDQTNMANINAKLEFNIGKIKELNMQLLKEKRTIDKKILFIKFDINGKIYDISKALAELLEYNKDDFIGESFFSYKNNTISEDIHKELLSHMKERDLYTFEQQVFTSGFKEVWLKSSLVPEYDINEVHLGFILFKQNITNRKFIEKNHEKVLKNSRNSAMGEMLSMIAHQWRQPLSLINTVLITIKIKRQLNQLNEKTLDEYFSKIESTTKYLSETIDDFKDYFKPTKNTSTINLLSLFDNSIFFLKDEMLQRNINYELNIQPEIIITTYKNELLQSIISILKNSIDAFEEVNTIKNIVVSVIKNEKNIVILIKDNAGGIKEEIINKIFEPYFSTKSKNGTGLGLYMCKTIINEHLQGYISITSHKKETKVIIELPLTLKE